LVYAGKVAYKYKGTMPSGTSLVLKEGTKGIAAGAFLDCSGLTSIEIPNSVTDIGEYSFAGCSTLTSIEIPNSVTNIGYRGFQNCSALTSIEIPNSVTDIGEYSFAGCSTLTSIEIPNSVTSIDNWTFEGCSSLTSIEIPNSVTSIGFYAFRLCTGLTSIKIPSSVTSIGFYAFQNCSGLTSIQIPSSVTSIGSYAFEYCSGLTSVTVEWETPISITSVVFSNCANATLFVPRGSKAAYETANYWKEFKEIVEGTEITIGTSGIATYSKECDLNFTGVEGLKAYIASGYNPATGDLTMTRVYKVPAGEGLLLKGAAGSYKVPYEETSAYYANLLVGVPTATTVNPTDGDYTNFILANDAVKGIGFYPLASAGKISANKAYLQLPTSILPATARSLRMVFDDEEDVTGVNALNVKGKMTNDKAVYDLQGRRVVKPTRGLYIKDGKKIMVK
jgi:hypothetical protein